MFIIPQSVTLMSENQGDKNNKLPVEMYSFTNHLNQY